MCGIGGILRLYSPGAPPPPPEVSIPDAWLDIIDESIKHRGPDGHGRFRDRATMSDGWLADVALVHRRLAIIDPASGQQPMVSERGRDDRDSGRVAVVFNGCVYNHRELRTTLSTLGHQFQTDHSDTEVFIHGFREWGHQFPDRLDGMFAAAIWSSQRGLLLVRDRTGEKPLYYSDELPFAGLAFASTPRALERLIRAQGRRISTDPRLLHSWVRFGFGRGTPTWDIQEIHPGSSLSSQGDSSRTDPVAFYDSVAVQGSKTAVDPLTVSKADELLSSSVTSRLEADVPLGCFLSGGVDSSLIAVYAQRVMKEQGRRLRTFSVRMPDPRYDESAYAARVAGLIGAEHNTLDASTDAASDLIQLIDQLGLPFGDSSLLPTYWVSRVTRQHVKVALSGDGGDELFAGYDRYLADNWLRRYGAVLSRVPAGPLGHAHPKSRRSKLARLLRAAANGGYPELLAIFEHADLTRLLGPSTPDSSRSDQVDGRWQDMGTYLPEDLLRKTDTASMSVALEARSPFLSRELFHAARNTPTSVLMPHGQRKGLLRAVARRYLPPEIVDRPKQGFAIPIGDWFRSDYGGMKTLLLDHLNAADPWPNIGIELNRSFVRQMIDEHMNEKRDHSQRLYMLLVLSVWAKSVA